jgi:hypothetical protein
MSILCPDDICNSSLKSTYMTGFDGDVNAIIFVVSRPTSPDFISILVYPDAHTYIADHLKFPVAVNV